MLTYRMAFANDWAEGLGMKLSEAIAADALLPETALTAPGACAGESAAVASGERDGTALQVDRGRLRLRAVGLRCGGAMETLGRVWIRIWCCEVRCGASRFRARDR